jgi:general stress protein 26
MDAATGVYDVLKRFETAVMVTGSDGGQVDCQLLDMAHVGECGTIWLLARGASGLLDQDSTQRKVVLMFQPRQASHMWLSGMAERVADSDRLTELWQGPFRQRFPDGPVNGEVLLAVRPRRASAWDADSYPRHFIFP